MDGQQTSIYFYFVTSLLLLTWYSCTSACNIYSKLYIQSLEPVHFMECAVSLMCLSIFQLLSGVLCGAIATGRIQSPFDLLKLDKLYQEIHEVAPANFAWFWNPLQYPEMVAASCHAIGGFCLNLCYLYSSVFIVQVLKCVEPVATLIISAIFLQEFPSVYLVSSVITIICGVALVCFKDSTISLVPVIIAITSNFLYPLRNVLGKKAMQLQEQQHHNEDHDGTSSGDTKFIILNNISQVPIDGSDNIDKEKAPLLSNKDCRNKNEKSLDASEVFYRVSFLSSYLTFPIFLCFASLHGMYMLRSLRLEVLLNLGLSGVTHAVYNVASYGTLQRMQSPTTHAIANVFKRIFTIGSAVVVFGDSGSKLSTQSYAGLAASSIGLIWYQLELAKSNKKH